MTRKPFSYNRDMLARFAKLMQLRRPPDLEVFKIRLPVDSSPCEDRKASELAKRLAELKKWEEDQ